jgi:hypothetical protein
VLYLEQLEDALIQDDDDRVEMPPPSSAMVQLCSMDAIYIYIDVQICMFSYILQLICLSIYFLNINAIYIKNYIYNRHFPDTSLPRIFGK